MTEHEQLEQAIGALEAQRAILGDAVVETALGPLRQKLAALVPPVETEQRKFVTVLFADVSGFTAMSEKMDSEEVREIMNAVWERLDAAITSHGGTVDKHIGDAVMALFGIPTAQEDDPERAIRAALAMQEELAAFVGRQTADDGRQKVSDESSSAVRRPSSAVPSLQMRIGINTGPVLLGDVGTRAEYTAMGDTVNVASRLEHAAPVGGILIAHDTYRHVRGVFDVLRQEPLQVKGKREPIETYIVQRAKPRAFRLTSRGVEGIETRMVGRDLELRRLQDAFYTAMEDREIQTVTVTGEAGVGKSRLLYEFNAWIELLPEVVLILQGRADSQMTNLPYSLMRDVLSSRFQIQDNDPPAVARDKLVDGIVGFMGIGSEEKAHFIGHLIGLDFSGSPYLSGILDDARQIRDQAFHYAVQFFEASTREQPALLMLEDLHWADDGSLDLVAHLMRERPHAPLMVLCMSRPTISERRPSWGEGQEGHTRLELHPLTKRDSRRLVAEVLQKLPEVPVALQELIVSGAEGNPFYVEELIKMLIDERVIMPGEERWEVEPGKLATVKIPPTLTGVLQARLDGLDPDERETLQRASVVGRIFWDGAVSRLGGAARPESVGHNGQSGDLGVLLSELRSKELVFRRESTTFAGTQEYLFKHAILHEVTYESVLKRKRRAYHAQAATWLVEQSGQRADEYAGLIGEHYERAGAGVQAAQWYARAGKQAEETYAPEAAIAFYQKALVLGREGSGGEIHAAGRFQVYEGLGNMLGQQARLAEAAETFKAMLEEAEEAEDTRAQSIAWWGLARLQDHQGNPRASLESGRVAEELARAAGAQVELAGALTLRGFALSRLGEAQEALRLGEEALALSTALQARREMSGSLNLLGMTHSMLGHFGQANAYHEQALALNRELGDRRRVAAILNNLGENDRLRGDYSAAAARYGEALIITREIGFRSLEMLLLNNLGATKVGLGEYRAAEADLRQAVEMGEAAGNYYVLTEAYRFLAEALLRPGNEESYLEEALGSARRALKLSQEAEDLEALGGAWRTLGLVAARISAPIAIDGAGYDAAGCFAESLRICAEVGMEAERARTLRTWAEYALKQGDREGGEAMWREARETFERLGMEPEVERMTTMPTALPCMNNNNSFS